MHAVQAGAAGRVWTALGRRLPRPRAIVVASAHWETGLPTVTTTPTPQTMHDFGGFPAGLYELRYPAPGAPDLAHRVLELLDAAGLQASGDDRRGLDHGAWVPLMHLYPEADIPVVQLSVQPSLGAEHHLRVGASLAPLAAEGVLIIGSGHMTHNLHDWMMHVRASGVDVTETAPAPYVEAFRRWIDDTLGSADTSALADWRRRAPHASRAHPTDEHFLPLPVAYGAAGPAPRIEHFDAGVDAGVLAMDACAFHPREA